MRTNANMKSKARCSDQLAKLTELRAREAQLALHPTADGYLELADEYHALGLNKESDRFVQLAETLEANGINPNTHPANGLMFGTVDPVMLVEVIQILSRTTLTGELIIDAPHEAFHLYFDEGHIISALCQSAPPGVATFRGALQVQFGTYRFIKKSVADISRVITARTEVLLLETLHDVDKQKVLS